VITTYKLLKVPMLSIHCSECGHGITGTVTVEGLVETIILEYHCTNCYHLNYIEYNEVRTATSTRFQYISHLTKGQIDALTKEKI